MNQLRNENIDVIAICDQNKAGTREKDVEIIQPIIAFEKYKDENFIISIQDKKIIKMVIGFMLSYGICESNIFIFDEITDEIV